MVADTQLYRGNWIDGVVAAELKVNRHFGYQYIASMPGQTTYWFSGGTVEGDAPFVGGSYITSGFKSEEMFRMVPWPGTGSVLGVHGGDDLVPKVAANTAIRGLYRVRVDNVGFGEGTGHRVEGQLLDANGDPLELWTGDYHLDEASHLSVGDVYEPHEVIGVMGETGTYASGKHDHKSLWTRPTPFHDPYAWVSKLHMDPLSYAGVQFTPIPQGPGAHLFVFNGGLAWPTLAHELQEIGASSAYGTFDGEFVGYVPAAPAFTNAAFLSHFVEDWIPAGTPLMVVT